MFTGEIHMCGLYGGCRSLARMKKHAARRAWATGYEGKCYGQVVAVSKPLVKVIVQLLPVLPLTVFTTDRPAIPPTLYEGASSLPSLSNEARTVSPFESK